MGPPHKKLHSITIGANGERIRPHYRYNRWGPPGYYPYSLPIRYFDPIIVAPPDNSYLDERNNQDEKQQKKLSAIKRLSSNLRQTVNDEKRKLDILTNKTSILLTVGIVVLVVFCLKQFSK